MAGTRRSPRGKSADAVRAELAEIFASRQGEGILLGIPQVFLRFSRCNLRCSWCDTPAGLRSNARYAVEPRPGGNPVFHQNPVTPPVVAGHLADFRKRMPFMRWVSLTGGEPLLYAPFLAALLPGLRRDGWRIYLDTNGVLDAAMAALRRDVDLVAMDFKLDSSSGNGNLLPRHGAFLEAAGETDVFAKVVVTAETRITEVAAAAKLFARHRPEGTLVLQPVSPTPRFGLIPSPGQLDEFRRTAGRWVADVRVIPQMHKLLGIR
ncbi:MAG: 7-carboxy-7-deazaguanine synthase QueE [Planctomycetota bacterium]